MSQIDWVQRRHRQLIRTYPYTRSRSIREDITLHIRGLNAVQPR
jgi:hypothetical protein